MDLEQLERKTSGSLSNGAKEDSFVKGEIKTDQILDQEEPAEIDSMDEADAGTHSAPKRVHTFYFVKFRTYELTKRMQCKIEQHKLETQRRRKEIEQFKKELTCIKEADQWTEALPNHVQTFYFIKYRPDEDPKIIRKVAHATFEIQRRKEQIDRLNETLWTIEEKHMSIRKSLHVNLYWDYYGRIAYSKSKELARIQDLLRKDTKNKMKPHLSEEDQLLKSIKTLNHHVQYKIMSAYEEKKLIKKIKEIEATREKIMANVYLEAKQNQEREENEKKQYQWLFKKIGNAPVKVWVKSQVKFIKIAKEMQLERMEKAKRFRKDLNALDAEIRLLKQQISTANSKMEKASEILLKSDRYDAEKLATLNEAIRALTKEKEIEALEELSKNEMEIFFLQWSNNKLFKDDYERRVLQSLESRGLSRDGRTRNSD